MSADPLRGERGATLLETLIALAIAGLLAATATQIAGFGLSAVERAEATAARSAAAYLYDRQLRDRLAAMDDGAASFRGGPKELRWRGPGDDGAAGIWRLDAEGAVAACPAIDASRCDAAAPWLAQGVDAFAYAGPDGAWRDEWQAGPAPDLIRISHGAWEIVIAPRVRGAR